MFDEILGFNDIGISVKEGKAMSQLIIIPLFVACLISLISGRFLIPFLIRLKAGQTVREDGPQTHLKKNGTPTMGGIIFLLSLTVVALCYAPFHVYILPILLLTLGFALIGFMDDYIKVVLKRSLGLRAWQKMGGQFIVTGVFAWYLVYIGKISLAMRIPFTNGQMFDLGIWNIPLLFLVVLGTVNGANFTDGLDGLATSVTIMISIFLTAAAWKLGIGITPLTMAMTGALLGFLFYNSYPASVFMGDTGSLALGGFVAGSAYILQIPLFIVIIGFIYLLEVISVILQVGYFKLTHGKRIFKMAPIHHHFEKCGYAETKVVAGFTIVTIILCLFAFVAL